VPELTQLWVSALDTKIEEVYQGRHRQWRQLLSMCW